MCVYWFLVWYSLQFLAVFLYYNLLLLKMSAISTMSVRLAFVIFFVFLFVIQIRLRTISTMAYLYTTLVVIKWLAITIWYSVK